MAEEKSEDEKGWDRMMNAGLSINNTCVLTAEQAFALGQLMGLAAKYKKQEIG